MCPEQNEHKKAQCGLHGASPMDNAKPCSLSLQESKRACRRERKAGLVNKGKKGSVLPAFSAKPSRMEVRCWK